MMAISLMSTMIILISMVVMLIASILSKKMISDREKSSPFECGFDPSSSSRLPFSLRFFLIAMIFLIFDVEIALLLPMILTLPFSDLQSWTITSVFFILILLIGLYHEWNQGALNWAS